MCDQRYPCPCLPSLVFRVEGGKIDAIWWKFYILILFLVAAKLTFSLPGLATYAFSPYRVSSVSLTIKYLVTFIFYPKRKKKSIYSPLKQGLPHSSNQGLANFVVLKKEKYFSFFQIPYNEEIKIQINMSIIYPAKIIWLQSKVGIHTWGAGPGGSM